MTTLSTNKFIGSLKFTLKGVKNAPSTAKQPGFTNVYFTDSSGFNVQQLISGAAASIDQTTKAANILKYSIYQDNLQMGAMATYRIEFTTTNSIGSGGSIVITWPAQVVINSTASCQVTTNTKQSNLCTIDPTKSTITIQNAFTSSTSGYAGVVIIELYPVQNPIDNQNLNGFTIATYNDPSFVYKIDVLGPNILTPNTSCQFPCNTCLGSDPYYCLSCWT